MRLFLKAICQSVCLTSYYCARAQRIQKLTGRVIIAVEGSCGLECVMSSSTLSLPLIHFLTKVPNDASFTDAPAQRAVFPTSQKEFPNH